MFRALLAALAILVVGAACSSAADQAVDDADTIPPPPELSTATTEAQGPPAWVGEAVNPLDVHMGECINRYSWTENDNRVELTTLVPCDDPHDREVFHETNFPAEAGAPFPGRAPMESFARTECYNRFEGFVGTPFEVSDLQITFTVPPEENFSDPQARYRGVVCYLFDPSGEPLVGTARQTQR